MSIINRRNAMIGWATWTLVKKTAAMKAKRVGSKLAPWSSRNGKNGKKNNKKGD